MIKCNHVKGGVLTYLMAQENKSSKNLKNQIKTKIQKKLHYEKQTRIVF